MSGLKNSDKKSDVYSLGKIINYIFTKDSENTSHELKYISEKATHKLPEYRYKDAGEMYDALQNRIEINMNESYKLKIFEEIKKYEKIVLDTETTSLDVMKAKIV